MINESMKESIEFYTGADCCIVNSLLWGNKINLARGIEIVHKNNTGVIREALEMTPEVRWGVSTEEGQKRLELYRRRTPEKITEIAKYEWDSVENKGEYNWCAHAALKMAAKSVKPSFSPTLLDIHDMFWDNSKNYRNNTICSDKQWCGGMADQLWAAQQPIRTQKYIANPTATKVETAHGFGLPNSVMRTGLNTVDTWFAKVKDGINFNYPVITFSQWNCSYGHSYVIVGYKDTGDVATSEILLRDSIVKKGGWLWDTSAKVKEFYNTGTNKELLFIKP